jgi:hypothetical protein
MPRNSRPARDRDGDGLHCHPVNPRRRGTLIRTVVSPAGFPVEWYRACGTYQGAEPFYVILPRKSPSRTRHVPLHLEDRARVIFEAFSQDVLDPEQVNERLRQLQRGVYSAARGEIERRDR